MDPLWSGQPLRSKPKCFSAFGHRESQSQHMKVLHLQSIFQKGMCMLCILRVICGLFTMSMYAMLCSQSVFKTQALFKRWVCLKVYLQRKKFQVLDIKQCTWCIASCDSAECESKLLQQGTPCKTMNKQLGPASCVVSEGVGRSGLPWHSHLF